MLRLVEQFYDANGKVPGLDMEDIESDTTRLKVSLYLGSSDKLISRVPTFIFSHLYQHI